MLIIKPIGEPNDTHETSLAGILQCAIKMALDAGPLTPERAKAVAELIQAAAVVLTCGAAETVKKFPDHAGPAVEAREPTRSPTGLSAAYGATIFGDTLYNTTQIALALAPPVLDTEFKDIDSLIGDEDELPLGANGDAFVSGAGFYTQPID